MRVQVSAATHRGAVRTDNQDCLVVDGWVAQASGTLWTGEFVVGEQPRLFAVLDGMGGYEGGALASLLAGHALAMAALTLPADPDRSALGSVVEHAAHAVAVRAQDSVAARDMGTTLVGAAISAAGVDVFNVGDCRAYQVVGDYLGQLTVDDRVPAPREPGRMLVSQSLGADPAPRFDPHHLRLPVDEPTCLLLCSDGLHDVVTADALAAAFFSESEDGRAVVQSLVRLALEHGAPDNVSVLLLEVGSA